MNTRAATNGLVPVVLGLSFAAGVAIWGASGLVTGKREPWDSSGPYFVITLFAAGVLSGAMVPRRFWLSWFGVWAGQVAGMLLFDLPLGPMAPLGMLVALPLYSLITLIGAALGALVGLVVWSAFRRQTSDGSPAA